MTRIHSAYTCDICGAGVVFLPDQKNDWESFSSNATVFTGEDYNSDDFLDIDTCAKCSAKVRNAIVSLQRDAAYAS